MRRGNFLISQIRHFYLIASMITMPTVKTSCRYYNVKLSSVFLKGSHKK